MKRCGVLQKVSRPKIRCHDTSQPEPNQLRSVPVSPMMSGTAVLVRAMATRRSGRAIVAIPLILRSLDELHARAVDSDGERRNDDPPPRVALAPHREPPGGESCEAAELAAVDGLGRGHERSGAPRLHLDEHVAIAVATDQVDLAKSRALVAGDDAHARSGELRLSRALAGEPQGMPIHAMKIGASLRRCDADDLVSRPVAGRQVERPVGALSSGAEAAVRPVKEDVLLSGNRAGEREAAQV